MAARKSKRHPDTMLHLEPKGEVAYQGRLYASTLQVAARDLDRVEGEYEITLEVAPPPKSDDG